MLRVVISKLPATYLEPNHFPEEDWNNSNEEKGYIKDMIKIIFDKRERLIF